MKHGFPISIDDTDVHGFGVQINTTIVLMMFSVKSHLVLLGLVVFWDLRIFSTKGQEQYQANAPDAEPRPFSA
jgi:hypothetical protein